MNISINTGLRANVSKLEKGRLLELVDMLDSDDTLERSELIAIGQELIDNNISELDGNNMSRLQYMLEAGKPVKIREVQNVFLDYAERAARGKIGGRRKSRKSRKSRKTRKSRKHRA